MKRISDWKEFVAKANLGKIQSDKLSDGSKDRILKFLKSQQPDAVAACYTKDEISGISTNTPLCSYVFDEYYWDSRDILYFEKYDMPLYSDFIKSIS